MELVVEKNGKGMAAAVVAVFGGTFRPPPLHRRSALPVVNGASGGTDSSCRSSIITAISGQTAEFLGLEDKLPVLMTGVSGIGALRQTPTILRFLAERSPFASTLLNSSPEGKADVDFWLSFASEKNFNIGDATSLNRLNGHLQRRTFFSCTNVTLSDLALYAATHRWMSNASTKELILYSNLTRWFSHVQNLPGIKGVFEWIEVIPLPTDVEEAIAPVKKTGGFKSSAVLAPASESGSPAAPGDIGKIEKGESTPSAGGKKGKVKDGVDNKAKESKGARGGGGGGASVERPVEDVTRVEVRVGKVLKAWKHPEAEKLYCEEIDIGEEAPRKIGSGLVGQIPLEKFEGQTVLVVANMKTKSLRGYPSHGMVLCVSDPTDANKLELLQPPAGTPIGERVVWEGLTGEPDAVMTTKTGKDPFVAVQPSFRTDENRVAFYKEHRFMTSKGPCWCDSITKGTIS